MAHDESMSGQPVSYAAPFATLRLERSSTVDRVVEELRRALFDGELESGTALREVALASSLGVSRSTVREALGVLVAEGLATREPHRGVSVSRPAASAVRDVCRARWVLEGAGVRGWHDASGEDRAAVRTALTRYTDAVAGSASYQELNERHLAFHLSLVALTGSPRMVAMAQSLMSELRLALAQVDRIRRNTHDQAESHAALVDLLEADDVASATDFLREHLADAEVQMVAALGPDAG